MSSKYDVCINCKVLPDCDESAKGCLVRQSRKASRTVSKRRKREARAIKEGIIEVLLDLRKQQLFEQL